MVYVDGIAKSSGFYLYPRNIPVSRRIHRKIFTPEREQVEAHVKMIGTHLPEIGVEPRLYPKGVGEVGRTARLRVRYERDPCLKK